MTTIHEPSDSRPSSRRVRRDIRYRPTNFVQAPAAIGGLLGNLGRTAGDIERVYMVGPAPWVGTPGGLYSFAYGDLPAGWAHDPDRPHYLSSGAPVLHYRSPEGRSVEVARAAQWFGEGAYTTGEAAEAWRIVRAAIGSTYPGAEILSTPATTGRDLFARTIPHGAGWPVLDDDQQSWIRDTAGQGRISRDADLAAHPEGDIPGLVEYDGRLMYAALCWGLPSGPVTLDTEDTYAPYVPGRYEVAFRVPVDWRTWCRCRAPGHAGIGLLGVRADGGGWCYPSKPGETGVATVDGAELHIAIEHGWPVTIRRRMLWPDRTGRPLDRWAGSIVAMRNAIFDDDDDSAIAVVLARNATRMMVLAAIGAFVGGPRAVTRHGGQGVTVPRDAQDVRLEGAHVVWTERAPAAWPAMSHPEWSAAVWGRARARLLDCPTGVKGVRAGALHVPAADVLAYRTDALYLAADPGWPDDGKEGRLRKVRHVLGPLPRPRSTSALLRARSR